MPMRYGVYTAMTVQVTVFSVVTPCSDVVEYQHFGVR